MSVAIEGPRFLNVHTEIAFHGSIALLLELLCVVAMRSYSEAGGESRAPSGVEERNRWYFRFRGGRAVFCL